jgi:hypothetical protein
MKKCEIAREIFFVKNVIMKDNMIGLRQQFVISFWQQ